MSEDLKVCPSCGLEYNHKQAVRIIVDGEVYKKCPHCDCIDYAR